MGSLADGIRTIFTIGHSTHPIEEFVAMLRAHGIELVVDVRTIPKSRHNPQFAQEALRVSLTAAGLDYCVISALGGLRGKAGGASMNMGWRNSSFRNYADYMQTPAFVAGLEELMRLAKESVTVIMCAEAVPWRCHRSLIGDALLVRGWSVRDIVSVRQATPHALTHFAQVDGLHITYPPYEDVDA